MGLRTLADGPVAGTALFRVLRVAHGEVEVPRGAEVAHGLAGGEHLGGALVGPNVTVLGVALIGEVFGLFHPRLDILIDLEVVVPVYPGSGDIVGKHPVGGRLRGGHEVTLGGGLFGHGVELVPIGDGGLDLGGIVGAQHVLGNGAAVNHSGGAALEGHALHHAAGVGSRLDRIGIGVGEVGDAEKTVLTSGWDGAWFLRAYNAFGAPVGSRECEEGQIYIEPQGMCVMAGIGIETGQAARALKSVEERLDTQFGIVLHQPPYTGYRLELGEISSYPPGYKENAGIFSHNNPWITWAETRLGHGDRAFETYRKLCPAYLENVSEIHRTEPYVYSQMVAGKDAAVFGEAKNSWLTGASAWSFTAISQAILGIHPELEGLRIDPCIPSGWPGFTVSRRFRGAVYQIEVENPKGVQHGVKELYADGARLKGTVIPPAEAGKTVSVRVIMG